LKSKGETLLLNGQAAIVTGGASGLGAETARMLVQAGARVAVVDVNMESATLVAAGIGGFAIRCDVSDAASAEAAMSAAREKHGAVRILVNCAGSAPAKRIVGRDGAMPLEDFAKVIQVNLVGTFNMMRLAAAEMSKLDPIGEERGVIISTASVAAYEGQIGQAAYSASKGGVAALTLPAARELAQFGVRVLAIAPGIFLTPMLMAMPEDVRRSLGASVPFPKRLGQPAEYAALVRHMIENPYLNGEVVRLDGALRMPPK
jgi:NAD(P)-dependent dehydrogenase (short-subunit alcohol dehydrogenase family)